MEALFNSTLAVAIAEIGDKTQLLSLFLATRFRQRHHIVLGILIATLVNHGLSAWLGTWVSQWIPDTAGRWIIGVSFIAVGLWVLVPDKAEDAPHALDRYGPFIATLVLFCLAEIGDKTQIATVVLAAQYESILWVTLGSTAGMLLANVPVVYAGAWLLQKIPLKLAHMAACVLFVGMGLGILVGIL